MPIHQLILENFKSYLGKHTIGPFKTFQAIIGPNGSGKSNLMDAISFVLGVSARILRSGKLKELIYSAGDDEKKTKTARNASVEMIYQLDVHDKADRKNAGVAAGADTIHFRRAVSAAGVGSYQIDGKHVDKDAYEEKLKSIGVLVKARNFLVFQGDVENIAAKSPAELTKLFEEISGSADFVPSYDETKEKHEAADQAMMAVFDKKRGATKDKKQVKEQQNDAARYKELVEAHKQTKQEFYLWQLFHLEKDMKVQHAELDDLRTALSARKADVKESEGKVKEMAKQVATLKRDLTVQEKEISKKNKDIDKLKPNQIKIKEQITFIQKSIVTAEAELKKAESDYAKKARDIAALEAELKDVERLKKEAEKAEKKMASEGKNEVKLATEQLAEYNKLKVEAGSRSAALRQQIDKHKREATSEKDRLSHFELEIQTLEDRKKQVASEIDALQTRKEAMDKNIDDVRKSLNEETKKFTEIEERTRNAQARQQELSDELLEVNNKLSEHSVDKRQNERESKFNEAIEHLKQLFPHGVRGRLVDLCKPIHAKYNVAVTVALGKMYGAVVVEDQKTGIECINYLKEQRVGVATFIPLDSIKVTPISDASRKIPGAQVVFDVIDCAESNHKALLYAVGNTLLTDTLNDARKIAYTPGSERKHKIVTLGGQIIHKTGNMTGGTAPDLAKKASVWDEKEVNKLREKKTKLFKEVVELEKVAKPAEDLRAMKVANDGLRLRLRNMEFDQVKTNDKLNKKMGESKDIDAQTAKITPKAEKSKKALAATEAEIQNLTESMLKQEDEVFAAFSKKVGVKSIREWEEKAKFEAEKLIEQQMELANRESKLKSQLDFLRLHDWKEPIQQKKQKIETNQNAAAKLQNELQKLEQNIETLSAELKQKQDAIAKVLKQAEALDERFQAVKKEASEKSKLLTGAENLVITKEATVDVLRSHRRRIFREAHMDGVDIPLRAGSAALAAASPAKKKAATPKKKKGAAAGGKKGKKKRMRDDEGEDDDDDDEAGDEDEDADADAEDDSEEKKSKKRRTGARAGDEKGSSTDEKSEASSSEGSEAERRAEEDAKIDYTELQKHRDVKTSDEFEQIKKEYQRTIRELKDQIEELAPAIGRFPGRLDEVKERLQATTEEWEEKKQHAKAAADKFEAVKKQRYEAFMKAFNHVTSKIDPIYKELTRSTQFPSGGKAFLELENSDEPYLFGVKYSAMPPGKRFRDIETLSGGEKTVAALALLFAIHSYHPAPFFVLDEVDAALDNINVDKISSYIRARTEAGLQCIVISLKDTFYHKADALVGIYRDSAKKSSAELTIDLTPYPL